MALHMRANSARNVGLFLIASPCCSAKLCSRDLKTEICVSRESPEAVRCSARCVVYCEASELRFAKAERPTPRERLEAIALRVKEGDEE